MDATVLSSFGGNVAAMALAGAFYFGFRLLRRCKCHSHTGCCDLELTKAETARDDRIIMKIIENIRKENGTSALSLDDAREPRRRPGDEGHTV